MTKDNKFLISKNGQVQLGTDDEIEAQKTIEAYKAADVASFALRNNETRSITAYWKSPSTGTYKSKTVQYRTIV